MDPLEKYWKEILSTPEEIDYKLSICKLCPQLNDQGGCMACGCMVDLKVKKRTNECPLGKW